MPELVKNAEGNPHFVDYTDPDALLTPQQASVLAGLSHRTLDNKRSDGTGPKYIRLSSRCVRYRRRNIMKWVAEHERTKTESRLPPRDQAPKVEAVKRVKP